MGRHDDLVLAVAADEGATGQRHFGLEIDQAFPTNDKHAMPPSAVGSDIAFLPGLSPAPWAYAQQAGASPTTH